MGRGSEYAYPDLGDGMKTNRSIFFDLWARDRAYAYLDLGDGAGHVPSLQLLTEVRPLALLVQVHFPANRQNHITLFEKRLSKNTIQSGSIGRARERDK
jgi:hypothetical protein